MIANIKLQQVVAQNELRKNRSTVNIESMKQDHSSADQYLASDLASVVKTKLQALNDLNQLDKVIELKNLNSRGLYKVDVDKLAKNILEQYT